MDHKIPHNRGWTKISHDDWLEGSRLRHAVAFWLRIKFAQDNLDTEMYRDALGDRYEWFVQQIQNDALHSGLLLRAVLGEEIDED